MFSEREAPEETPKAVEIPEAEKAQAERQDNLISFKKALAQDDESLCHNITDDTLRRECFDRTRLAAALEIEEVSLCTLIAEEKTKAYCLDTLIAKKALAEKNPSLCVQISQESGQNRCFESTDQEVFLSAKAPGECEKIQSVETRKSCVDHFLLQELRNHDDSSACSQFVTRDGQQKCEDYFWSLQATEAKDPTLCLNIASVEEQEKCESSMSLILEKEEKTQGMLEGKSEYCADFIDEKLKTQCQNEAHYYAAKIYRDVKYCEKIEDDTLFANRCLDELTALNDEFWLDKAKAEKNETHCDRIKDRSRSEYCKALVS